MEKKTLNMTSEKFQEIYNNKKLRNDVAFAHGCYDKNGSFLYKKTCSYPVDYIVDERQIELAEKELERSKKETAENYKNSLLFVGMGMTFETKTGIGNHRIRSEFVNKNGERFFVEFGTSRNIETARCDHSIKIVKDKQGKDEHENNYGGIERNFSAEYTPESILSQVNRIFDCEFKDIFIDNYDLECDGIMCESPRKETK